MDNQYMHFDSSPELVEYVLPHSSTSSDPNDAQRSCNDSSDSEEEPFIAPPHLVQITASKHDVTQMINSFLAGKRARVINQQNIHEFCGPDYDGQSCARVGAVHFTKRLVQVEDAEKYWEKFKKK